jgi:hypothetical protein
MNRRGFISLLGGMSARRACRGAGAAITASGWLPNATNTDLDPTAAESKSFLQGGFAMASALSVTAFVAGVSLVASLATAAHAQSPQYPKPTELPNPYRLVEGWPTLPESMNGGHWGEVIRVHVHTDGNIWVFHRCFNTVPPGIATCLGRGEANPPILQFDPSGKLLKSLGGGMFVNPHGFTVDHEGNLWDIKPYDTRIQKLFQSAFYKIPHLTLGA